MALIALDSNGKLPIVSRIFLSRFLSCFLHACPVMHLVIKWMLTSRQSQSLIRRRELHRKEFETYFVSWYQRTHPQMPLPEPSHVWSKSPALGPLPFLLSLPSPPHITLTSAFSLRRKIFWNRIANVKHRETSSSECGSTSPSALPSFGPELPYILRSSTELLSNEGTL
jgi:hypothetical protein